MTRIMLEEGRGLESPSFDENGADDPEHGRPL